MVIQQRGPLSVTLLLIFDPQSVNSFEVRHNDKCALNNHLRIKTTMERCEVLSHRDRRAACDAATCSVRWWSGPAPPLWLCHPLCGFLLPFAGAGRSRPSTSALTVMVMPSRPPTALLVPPTLSFSQFPATPLGSWVLSEKLSFTEPHRCQPIAAWEEDGM